MLLYSFMYIFIHTIWQPETLPSDFRLRDRREPALRATWTVRNKRGLVLFTYVSSLYGRARK